MLKKTQLSIFIILIASCAYAQTGLELFRQHTSGIISFINSEQETKTKGSVDFKMPSSKLKNSSRTKGNTSKNSTTFVSQSYDFSNKTAYGKFEVLVITTSPNSFTISFGSQYPIQQYQLKDSTNKNTTKEESLNDKLTYTITVPKPFEPKYVLILSMLKDEFLSPNIIPLYKKENIKFK